MLRMQIQNFETLENKIQNFQIKKYKLQFSLAKLTNQLKSVTFYLVWPN